ncbi:MAG TPA: hypothetical protein VMV69_20310 [Pirellulales bacterium]|nr:hypothetical protein [Pirellulales bacterium]
MDVDPSAVRDRPLVRRGREEPCRVQRGRRQATEASADWSAAAPGAGATSPLKSVPPLA